MNSNFPWSSKSRCHLQVYTWRQERREEASFLLPVSLSLPARNRRCQNGCIFAEQRHSRGFPNTWKDIWVHLRAVTACKHPVTSSRSRLRESVKDRSQRLRVCSTCPAPILHSSNPVPATVQHPNRCDTPRCCIHYFQHSRGYSPVDCTHDIWICSLYVLHCRDRYDNRRASATTQHFLI